MEEVNDVSDNSVPVKNSFLYLRMQQITFVPCNV
jgi:hypothetical protein